MCVTYKAQIDYSWVKNVINHRQITGSITAGSGKKKKVASKSVKKKKRAT